MMDIRDNSTTGYDVTASPENTSINFTNNMTSTSGNKDYWSQFPAYVKRCYDVVWYCYLPIILIGFVLNTVCLVVLIRMKMSRTAVGLHLIWIAISDNLMLLAKFFREGYIPEFFYPEMADMEFYCRYLSRMSSVAFRLCVFLITSATIERFLSLVFPLKIKTWPMLLITKLLIGFYVIWSFIDFFMLTEHFFAHNGEKCTWIAEVSIHADVMLYGIHYPVPILVFIVTVAMAVVLVRGKRKRDSMRQIASSDSSDSKEFRICVMLFVVAMTFLFSRLQEDITRTLAADYVNDSPFPSPRYSLLKAFSEILSILFPLYHSTNFFIYFVFMQNFREVTMSCFREKDNLTGSAQTSEVSLSSMRSSKVKMTSTPISQSVAENHM